MEQLLKLQSQDMPPQLQCESDGTQESSEEVSKRWERKLAKLAKRVAVGRDRIERSLGLLHERFGELGELERRLENETRVLMATEGQFRPGLRDRQFWQLVGWIWQAITLHRAVFLLGAIAIAAYLMAVVAYLSRDSHNELLCPRIVYVLFCGIVVLFQFIGSLLQVH